MGSEGSMSDDELLKSIAQLRETYKGNLTLANFDETNGTAETPPW